MRIKPRSWARPRMDCRNQVFILPTTDGIYLVGGIEEDLLHLAQRFTGSGIAGSEAHQLLIEENAVRKMAVSAADGHRLTLESQRGVHILHMGELHEQAALVYPAGGGSDRGAIYIIGREGGEIGSLDAQREKL